MINLLPADDKRQLRASRANTLLLRYNILMLGAFVFMMIAVGIAYVFLTNTQATAEKTVLDNQKEVSGFAEVQAQEKKFKENLSTAKTILDKEVIYTRTILAISKLLPSGIVLDNLNLDAQTFGTQTTLAVQSKDIPTAVALKTALEGSPIFSNVHFQSIQSAATPGTKYPITVNLNVTIDKEEALRDPSADQPTSVTTEKTATPGVSP
jgi:Tfp pilus assembly protein PilN